MVCLRKPVCGYMYIVFVNVLVDVEVLFSDIAFLLLGLKVLDQRNRISQ